MKTRQTLLEQFLQQERTRTGRSDWPLPRTLLSCLKLLESISLTSTCSSLTLTSFKTLRLRSKMQLLRVFQSSWRTSLKRRSLHTYFPQFKVCMRMQVFISRLILHLLYVRCQSMWVKRLLFLNWCPYSLTWSKMRTLRSDLTAQKGLLS